MKSYFDSLMRSTGRAIGELPPATAPGDPGVVELNVEHRQTAAPSLRTETQAVVRQPVHQAPAGQAIDKPQAASDALESPSMPATNVTQPAPPTPDLGKTLLRAAMKWVAADATPATPPIRDRVVLVPAEPGNAQPFIPATPSLEVREVAVAPSRPIREARSTLTAPVQPAPKVGRDGPVEVSIGAIHVRVDAPAAQIVARPAGTPPAVARAAAPASPRSALSRRALRRI